jgi:hypothetical protein
LLVWRLHAVVALSLSLSLAPGLDPLQDQLLLLLLLLLLLHYITTLYLRPLLSNQVECTEHSNATSKTNTHNRATQTCPYTQSALMISGVQNRLHVFGHNLFYLKASPLSI